VVPVLDQHGIFVLASVFQLVPKLIDAILVMRYCGVQNERTGPASIPDAHQSCQLPLRRTHVASSALVMAWAATASPIRPRQRNAEAYSSPAIVPASQRFPCRIPNATDESRKGKKVRLYRLTASKSAETSRRRRKPRKASSSAIGTVTEAASVRQTSHATRAYGDRDASPAPMPLSEPGGRCPV